MVPTGLSPGVEFVLYVGTLMMLLVGAGVLGYQSGRRSRVRDRRWYAELELLRGVSADLILLHHCRPRGGAGMTSSEALVTLMTEARRVLSTYQVPEHRESLFADGVCAIFDPAEESDPVRAQAGIRYVEQQIQLRCRQRKAQGGR